MAGAGATLTADCSGVVLDQTTNKPAKTGETGTAQAIGVYPNPAKGKVIITVTLKKSEQAVIRMYDVEGRLVNDRRTITGGTTEAQKVQYNLTGIKPGVYSIVVTTSEGVQSINKLMVQ